MRSQRIIQWSVAMVLGLMFLPAFVPHHSRLSAALTRLPFGWVHFLNRNWPQMSWNWSLIGTGVICSIGMIVLAHWLLRILFQQVQPKSTSAPPWRWRWRWTFGGYAAVWLLFCVAFGAAGSYRHATWLMSYAGPWYTERWNHRWDLRNADLTVFELADGNGQSLPATRQALFHERSGRIGGLLIDDFDVLFYGDKSNRIAAYLIVPRSFTGRAPEFLIRNATADYQADCQTKSLAELPQAISNLDLRFSKE